MDMGGKFLLRIENDLVLELLNEDHAAELFELTDSNRAFLKQWLPWLDSNKYLQNTVDYITYSQKQYAENISLQLAIRYMGRISGMIGFHKVDWLNHSTSIGYWLGESYQGKGLITRSCRCLIDYAFVNLGLNRIEIRCAAGNMRSRAIPERLGFRVEGTLRQAEWLYDRYVDHVIYAMLKEDWNPQVSEGGISL